MARIFDDAERVSVRGVSFENVFRHVEREYGVEMAERLRARMEGEAIAAIRAGSLRRVGWYPIDEFADLYRYLLEETGQGIELPRAIAREVAHHAVPSFFQMFTRILSPQLVIRRALPLFRRFYDAGEPSVVEHGKNFVVIDWRGCHGFSPEIWADLEGAMEGTLEVAGAKEIVVKKLEGGEGPDARYRVRWR